MPFSSRAVSLVRVMTRPSMRTSLVSVFSYCVIFSLVFTLSARHSAGFLLSVYGKVRFVGNKEMIKIRERTLSGSLRSPAPPKGGAFCIFRSAQIKLPLRGKTSPAPGEDVAQRQKGESGTAQAVTERARTLPLCSKHYFHGRVPPLFAKKITGSGKAGRLKPKIRTNACFTVLKTYKTAKKFSLFLVRLLGGLRLLCGQNLLL